MGLSGAFKKEAEAIAEEVRNDLGIGNIKALDPFRLLASLSVPVISLTQLSTVSKDPSVGRSVTYLQEVEHSLSAVTVFAGRPQGASVATAQRMVVFNDTSAAGRRASDLTHEAAHGLLLHEPAAALDGLGCRAWNTGNEDEAQYLGGCLLIPGKGARYAAKAGWSFEEMARRFACSPEMAAWRNNISGGNKIRSIDPR